MVQRHKCSVTPWRHLIFVQFPTFYVFLSFWPFGLFSFFVVEKDVKTPKKYYFDHETVWIAPVYTTYRCSIYFNIVSLHSQNIAEPFANYFDEKVKRTI